MNEAHSCQKYLRSLSVWFSTELELREERKENLISGLFFGREKIIVPTLLGLLETEVQGGNVPGEVALGGWGWVGMQIRRAEAQVYGKQFKKRRQRSHQAAERLNHGEEKSFGKIQSPSRYLYNRKKTTLYLLIVFPFPFG